MKKISKKETEILYGGANQIECFFAGALFAAAIATGNVIAAGGTGIFLASNCFS
jgi:hypothetical protein